MLTTIKDVNLKIVEKDVLQLFLKYLDSCQKLDLIERKIYSDLMKILTTIPTQIPNNCQEKKI